MNGSNLILPVRATCVSAQRTLNIYANSQFPDADAMNSDAPEVSGKFISAGGRYWPCHGRGRISQYNIVRIDGQRSVYVPVFKQGGNSNTITIVDGIKAAVKHLVDIPESLKTAVVFDQSVFVKLAISNVSREELLSAWYLPA